MPFMRIVPGVALLLFVAGRTAIAGQQDAAPTAQAAAERAVREKAAADFKASKDIFDAMQRNSAELHRSTLRRDPVPVSVGPFRMTVPKFREATESFRAAISSEKDLKNSVRDVTRSVKPVEDYFNTLKLKPKPVDRSEFKDYSQKELNWETLSTAERIDNSLQEADILLQRISKTGATSIQVIEFFMGIHSDIARFKWLAEKVEPLKKQAAK